MVKSKPRHKMILPQSAMIIGKIRSTRMTSRCLLDDVISFIFIFQLTLVLSGSEENITDGKWHSVSLNRRGWNLRLTLDDKLEARGRLL